MKYLLDTCVLSELNQLEPNPNVNACLDRLPRANLFISTITIGEITKGVHMLEEGRKRHGLERWLEALETDYEGRILPVTVDISRLWGELLANAKKQGIGLPVVDGLIAATAIHHGMHVVTRNVIDFMATGVLITNPWEEWKN